MDLKFIVAMLKVLSWEVVKSMPEPPRDAAPPQKLYEWDQWLKAKAFVESALYCLERVQGGAANSDIEAADAVESEVKQ